MSAVSSLRVLRRYSLLVEIVSCGAESTRFNSMSLSLRLCRTTGLLWERSEGVVGVERDFLREEQLPMAVVCNRERGRLG